MILYKVWEIEEKVHLKFRKADTASKLRLCIFIRDFSLYFYLFSVLVYPYNFITHFSSYHIIIVI